MAEIPQIEQMEYHIVCVDDDMDFLKSVELFLPDKLTMSCRDFSNYNYSFLSDPYEAIQFIQEVTKEKEEIVLIISDQKMPKMKGTDFLLETMHITPNSKRVLLTGYAGLESAVIAINENILDKYLTKPVEDANDFVVSVRQLIDTYHLGKKVSVQSRVIRDLYNFANELNSIEDFEKTLNYIISFITKTLDCTRVSIMLKEEKCLRIKASVGISEGIVENTSIPIGEYISGGVFAKKEALFIPDVDEASWLKSTVKTDHKSFISFPMLLAGLVSDEEAVGVINVTNKRDNRSFTQHDFETLNFIANTASIAIHNHFNRLNLKDAYFETTRALAQAIEAKDGATGEHCERIEKYAIEIAREMGISSAEIENLRYAAILHDVGKIGVREDVLKKTGRLTPEEYEEIKKHPVIGAEIVKGVQFLTEVIPVIYHHQERYDGKGYPSGLSGEAVPLGSRIIAIIDTFDAMTSDRCYRKALSIEDAIAELMRCAGTQFDPAIVDLFIKVLKKESSPANSVES